MIPKALQSTPNSPGAAGAALRFATDTHPGADGFEAWRESFVRKVARLEVTADDPARFQADIRARPFPSGITLSRNRFGACSVMRTADLLRDGDDAVTLKCCLTGSFDAHFGDDRVRLAPGQAALFPHARVNDTRVGAGSGSYTLRLEHDVARALIPRFDPRDVRVLAPDGPALTLLRKYCDVLMSQDLPGPLASTAGNHLGDLVAHVVAGAMQAGSSRGVREARLTAIKDDILKLIDHEDFSIGMIALRHRVTPRYIQTLFDEEGVTFTEYVLNARLARAHRMLTNPRCVGQKISAIAYDCGFGDLSYFIRAFRRRYGALPSDVRAQAARLLNAIEGAAGPQAADRRARNLAGAASAHDERYDPRDRRHGIGLDAGRRGGVTGCRRQQAVQLRIPGAAPWSTRPEPKFRGCSSPPACSRRASAWPPGARYSAKATSSSTPSLCRSPVRSRPARRCGGCRASGSFPAPARRSAMCASGT
jgi:AraC-like DNA-binding protein